MAARKTTLGIDAHPMRNAIVQAHLSGQSLRKIASWCVPPVSHNAISRYISQRVAPVMSNAEALKLLLRANKDGNKEVLAELHGVTTEQHVEQLSKIALNASPILAIREKRISELQDRHDRLKLIVEERGAEMAGETAGGASGLLTRDYKGKDADRAVYKLDTGLLSEFREHEKQAAQELGQWQETTGPTIAIQIVVPAPAPAQTSADPITYTAVEIGSRNR